MLWYYNCLVRRPYLMILAISVFSFACIIVSYTSSTLPDFSDPSLGFETRGTSIAKRLTAWINLKENTGVMRSLVANPNDLREYKIHLHNEQLLWHKNYNGSKNRKGKNKKKKLHGKKYEKLLTHVSAENNSESEEAIEQAEVERSPLEWNGDRGIFRGYEITDDSPLLADPQNRSGHFQYGHSKSFIDENDQQESLKTKKTTWSILRQSENPPVSDSGFNVSIKGFFCDRPSKGYSHFVVEMINSNLTTSMFSLNGLLAMCELQKQLTTIPSYDEYCQKEKLNDNCCRSWSLPNYASLLANKSSCFDLTEEDVLSLENLLLTCFEYYQSLKLNDDCNKTNRCFVPQECVRHNAVYNILHFLTDHNILKPNSSTIFLTHAMIFVPVAQSVEILPLFHEWERAELKNEIMQVVAMDLGLENELFNECLITDGWLVALGALFVMTCIWLYTASVLITLMTCIAVFFSLGLAYFIYTFVFEMYFFPYMNLLAVVVIIGIGADDAFIFIKIWHCVLIERFSKPPVTSTETLPSTDTDHTETLQNLMALTLGHAAVSILVTSLTTACAFYASYISSITAIKCFGIFAGTVVMTNYLLMITWLPATVSIKERLSVCPTVNCRQLSIQQLILLFNKSISKFYNKLEAVVVRLILNFSVFWLILFGLLGICSAVVVLYFPGLQMPDSAHFQLFVDDHPFEKYHTQYKNKFWFEKSMLAYENYKLPLRFVWGIQAIDDGDYSNPNSHGNLYYDNTFNISAKAAQVWLLEFCKQVRKQPFCQPTFSWLLPNCFIENFITIMERMCIDHMDDSDRSPCCDVSKFPFEPHIFDLCLPQTIASLYATPQFFPLDMAGPKFLAPEVGNDNEGFFDKKTTNLNMMNNYPSIVKAIVIEFESNVTYSTIYEDIRIFVRMVEDWFVEQLRTAPPEMQGGWFISELKFFDVQSTLTMDTIVAISVAMSVSLLVLSLVTLNVLISFYSVITVLLTIFTTVAILILLGWRLNIVESVTVSTAIGLAVDFSLHYGIHYRLSPNSERNAATEYALTRIIGPTAMAATTTGIAGAFLLTSDVLPYVQIGMFLVIVITVSWFYATFFLISLMKLAGPQFGFLQFQIPKFRKNRKSDTNGLTYYDRKQSQVVATEQLLTPSSSAVGELINSETHELESLTSNSLLKTISGTECVPVLPLDSEHSFHAFTQDHLKAETRDFIQQNMKV